LLRAPAPGGSAPSAAFVPLGEPAKIETDLAKRIAAPMWGDAKRRLCSL